MILIRAPPTMACGIIRRVVLENEKTNSKNSKHVNGNTNSSNSSSSSHTSFFEGTIPKP